MYFLILRKYWPLDILALYNKILYFLMILVQRYPDPYRDIDPDPTPDFRLENPLDYLIIFLFWTFSSREDTAITNLK